MEDGDCDDDDVDVFPGATEVCNGVDDNCDDVVDEGVTTTFYADTDGDDFGDALSSTEDCSAPSGYVTDNTDCDDGDREINPDATEVCDDVDNNCDSAIDEGVTTTFYADTDGDSYGDALSSTDDCSAPSGYVSDNTDCDDTNGSVNPAASELCDGLDNDCDASTTEDGLASFLDSSGVSSDVTSIFSGDVSLSSDGTYTLCDGTWTVNLDIDADITIESAGGAAVTTLDGSAVGSVLDIGDGYSVSVSGFTIADGSADAGSLFGYTDMGGGIYCGEGSTLTLTDSALTDNTASLGGGLAGVDCDIEVVDSTFDGSYGSYGGDIFIWDGALDLSGIASTSAEATASGAFVYLGAASAALEGSIADSTVDGSTSAFAAVYVDGANGNDSVFTCNGAAFTSNTVDDYGVVFVNGEGAYADSFGCDWGTDSGGDNNSPADVYTYGSGESFDFEDGDFFSCDVDGCEDTVLYAGVTGTYTHTYSDWSTTPASGSYACEQEWDIAGTGTSSVCDSCDFAFDATWTLDTVSLIDTDCDISSSDYSYGLGFASMPAYYSSPTLYVEYSGTWYAFAYSTRSGNHISFTSGVFDYSYYYYGSTYYYTKYYEMDLYTY